MSERPQQSEWPEWRREWERARPQLNVWVSRGQDWAHNRQQIKPPRSRTQEAVRGVVMLPLNLLTGALGIIAGLLAACVGLLVVALVAWIGMGVLGAAMAARNGWDFRLGWVLGFTLGPIGVALARLLPTR